MTAEEVALAESNGWRKSGRKWLSKAFSRNNSKMVKNTGKSGKYGFFTNLALFYNDVSMTSLVGHGEVTSADVIGRRGSG